MGAALVVMAAGLGSRYGGEVKQVERVGPGGEILMEYAIWDAVRAGFDRIVIVIKPEMRESVEELFGKRVERGTGIKLCYAAQRMDGAWNGIPIPAARTRTKPLGTVHALLSARAYLDRPFVAINADDFYGRGAIRAMGAALSELRGAGESVMAAYRLKNTVSPFGTVTRGICAVADGYLQKVTETYHIALGADGAIRDASTAAGGDAEGILLPPEAPVSMNLWGFHPDVLERMEERFHRFLRELAPEDNSSEYLLPVMMDEMIGAGDMRCRALETDEHWFGLTYPQDKPGVVAGLRALHDAGEYPPALW